MTIASTPIFGRRTYGRKNPTTGTDPFLLLVEPMSVNAYTYIEFMQWTTTTTAQVLTVMRPLSNTNNGAVNNPIPCSCYLTSATSAGASYVLNINQDPGLYVTAGVNNYTFGQAIAGSSTFVCRTANNGIAASDNIAYQYPDGSWGIDTVASVSSLAITMSGTLGTGGLPAGTPIWWFGVKTDTNPYDALAHPVFTLACPTSPTTINFGSEGNPWMGTFNRGQPLLLSVTNTTTAVVLERMTAVYSDRGSPFAW